MKTIFAVFRQQVSRDTKEHYTYLFEVNLSTISVEEFIQQYQYTDTVELLNYTVKEVK